MLNTSSKIGKILTNSHKYIDFYSCYFLKHELLNHRKRLIELTNLSVEELEELEILLTQNITFLNEEIVPNHIFIETEKILEKIDINDTPFVALTKYMENATLWTGDKKLIEGLKVKNFINTITTTELYLKLEEFEL